MLCESACWRLSADDRFAAHTSTWQEPIGVEYRGITYGMRPQWGRSGSTCGGEYSPELLRSILP